MTKTNNNLEWINPSDLSGSSDAAMLCRQWVFRMLIEGGGLKLFINNSNIHDESKAFVGMNETDFGKKKHQEISALLKIRHGEITAIKVKRKSALFKNIQKIKTELDLSKVDAEIFTFACLVKIHTRFGRCFDLFDSISNGQLYALLSHTLGIKKQSIIKSLHKDGILSRSGLLDVSNENNDLEFKLDMLDGLYHSLEVKQKDIKSLFASYVISMPAAKLHKDDYAHIATDYKRLKRYLKQARKQRLVGANILLYGAPGTGKTELVNALTRDAGLTLYGISIESADGDTLTGKKRVAACQLAQRLLRNNKDCCLLFDEIEDLFPNDLFSLFTQEKKSGRDKAWINHLLENNEVPTFWVTNTLSSLDNAFIRRFDYVLEMKVPPRSVRKRILQQFLPDDAVSEDWLDRIAAIEDLSPAVIERAVRVGKLLDHNSKQLQENLEQLIVNSLNAMKINTKGNITEQSAVYDPSLLHTSGDLQKINNGLAKTHQGRLCFYGPPGTGKSAYAHYLAQSLDQPLLAKEASQIINCYIGESEKNIARMFEQASDEKSILLLDEADSFLRDRRLSRNSWEVTQVNELLMQMERYQGIFVCSTNLMDNLDAAVLRRFDFKLKFDFLKPKQASQLFEHYMTQSQSKSFSEASIAQQCKTRLLQMNHLTPGDFATVQRQLAVLEQADQPLAFMDALQAELGFKQAGSKPIGFLSTV